MQEEGVGDGPGKGGGVDLVPGCVFFFPSGTDGLEAVEPKGVTLSLSTFDNEAEGEDDGYEPPADMRLSSSRRAINFGSQTDLDLFLLEEDADTDNPCGDGTCVVLGS